MGTPVSSLQGFGYGPAGSSTSLTVGYGAQTFTIQYGLAYVATDYVILTSIGSGAWMYGTVTSYSGNTMVMNVINISGSGTHTDWALNPSGQPPLPGVWIALTLNGGWANIAGSNIARARIEVDGVTVRLSGKVQLSSGSSIEISYMPSLFQPAKNIKFPCWDSGNSDSTAYLEVDPTFSNALFIGSTFTNGFIISLEGITYPLN